MSCHVFPDVHPEQIASPPLPPSRRPFSGARKVLLSRAEQTSAAAASSSATVLLLLIAQ
jgi:hypothetical protein